MLTLVLWLGCCQHSLDEGCADGGCPASPEDVCVQPERVACGDAELVFCSDAFTSQLWYFRDGVLIGLENHSDYIDATCQGVAYYGEIPDCE